MARYRDANRPTRAVPPTSKSGWKDALSDLRHGAPRRVITDALAEFARDLPPGGRVLEVGAGHYDHTPWFADQHVTLLDYDETQRPDVRADAHTLPLADASFDAIIAISVLEHVQNPFRVVRELERVMKPGARAFVWVPFYFAEHGFPGDVTRFTCEGLRQCFEEVGLDVEHASSEPYDGLFFFLSDQVHFLLPRQHRFRLVRIANRVAFMTVRLFFRFDKRLKVRRLYAGTELIAVRPSAPANVRRSA